MRKPLIGLGKLLFRIRGLTPIPFYVICLIFASVDLRLFLPGFLLIGLGEFLRLYSVGYLGIASRKTDNATADELVINGPYRFVRNPIYLGNMLIYLGFAVLSNVFFPLFPILTLVFFTFDYYLITCYEENELQTKFGRSYEEYLLRVHRFLPLRPLQEKLPAKRPFDFKKALRSEKVTFLVLTLALFGILLRHFTS
jgi:protein-S-isoprenylcysteine O-methyltransferase Ste14